MITRNGVTGRNVLADLVFEAINNFDAESDTLEQDEHARENVIGLLCRHLAPHVDPEVIAEEVKNSLDEILRQDQEH